MARSLQIIGPAGETLDLLSGVLRLKVDGWESGDPDEIAKYYTTGTFGGNVTFEGMDGRAEVLELVAKGEPPAGIRAAINEYHDMVEGVRACRADPMKRMLAWWYRWASEGETAKQAAILQGKFDYKNFGGRTPLLLPISATRANLGLLLAAAYEDTADTQELNSDISADGAKVEMSGAGGNLPARIRLAKFTASTDNGGDINKVWCGIRPEYNGTTHFWPVWDLGTYGVLGTDAVRDNDATAYGGAGGKRLTINFAVATGMDLRTYCTVTTQAANTTPVGTGNWNHYDGQYQVLCRAKVSATGTCAIEMRYGTSSSTSSLQRFNTKFVTETDWRYFEMGTIVIPHGGVYNSYSRTSTIYIYGEQTDGTPDLHIDDVVLVPNYHYCAFKDGVVRYHALLMSAEYTNVWTTPFDEYFGSTVAGDEAGDVIAQIQTPNWYFPIEDNVMVVVGERDTAPTVGDLLDADLYYNTRWRMYR